VTAVARAFAKAERCASNPTSTRIKVSDWLCDR